MSDVTLRDLPAEGTFLAMQKDIRGLTAVGASQVLAEKARESGQRIIGTRWLVTNKKEEAQESVRARIVVSLPVWASVQSRSLSGRHVSTSFLDPVLGAMMKQVCWHSRRSKAYRGLPEARMAASRLLRMCWSSRGLPRLLLAPFTAPSEK